MKPVSLEDFGAHISRMHADRDKWFEMEYNVSALLSLATPNLYFLTFGVFLERIFGMSEASPTLGCSIEISRDIYNYIYNYMYVYDCLWENNTKNHMLKCVSRIM